MSYETATEFNQIDSLLDNLTAEPAYEEDENADQEYVTELLSRICAEHPQFITVSDDDDNVQDLLQYTAHNSWEEFAKKNKQQVLEYWATKTAHPAQRVNHVPESNAKLRIAKKEYETLTTLAAANNQRIQDLTLQIREMMNAGRECRSILNTAPLTAKWDPTAQEKADAATKQLQTMQPLYVKARQELTNLTKAMPEQNKLLRQSKAVVQALEKANGVFCGNLNTTNMKALKSMGESICYDIANIELKLHQQLPTKQVDKDERFEDPLAQMRGILANRPDDTGGGVYLPIVERIQNMQDELDDYYAIYEAAKMEFEAFKILHVNRTNTNSYVPEWTPFETVMALKRRAVAESAIKRANSARDTISAYVGMEVSLKTNDTSDPFAA